VTWRKEAFVSPSRKGGQGLESKDLPLSVDRIIPSLEERGIISLTPHHWKDKQDIPI
jgi:hypothetical protein